MATTTARRRLATPRTQRKPTPEHMKRREVARRARMAQIVAKLLGSKHRLAYMRLPSQLSNVTNSVALARSTLSYSYLQCAERLDYSALSVNTSSVLDRLRTAETELRLLIQHTDDLAKYAADMAGDDDPARKREQEQKELTASIYESLTSLQVSNMFSSVTYSLRPPIITAVTKPITIDDDDEGYFELGAYSIVLDVNTIVSASRTIENGRRAAYTVSALEPLDGCTSQGHPHVSNNRLCEGEAVDAVRFALTRCMFDEFFSIVYATLQTYNPDSAYIRLGEMRGQEDEDEDESECEICSSTVSSDSLYTCDVCSDATCANCRVWCELGQASLCNNCASRKIACRLFSGTCRHFGESGCYVARTATCNRCGDTVAATSVATCTRGSIVLCGICQTLITPCVLDGLPCPAYNRARCLLRST